MDYGTAVEVISTLGFPIACCGYMAWYMNKMDNIHREDISRLSDIIQGNTIALTQLTEKMEHIQSRSTN